MAYKHTNSKGKEYYLHSRSVGKGGGKLYFFAKEVKEEGAEESLPDGYEIVENERTGLPTLKKKAPKE
jgi:hypothetical protein